MATDERPTADFDKPARPKLPPEDEERFVALDQRKAEVYTAIESAAGALNAALRVAEDGAPQIALDFSETTATHLIAHLQKKDGGDQG